MSDTEIFYAWVRVGGGDPEPAAIEGEKPNRVATTIGCPDPFRIDEDGCPCVLLYWSGQGMKEEYEIEPPDDAVDEAEADRQHKKWQAYIKANKHSYAGFGQRSKKVRRNG